VDDHGSIQHVGVEVAEPRRKVKGQRRKRHVPRFHVILWDSNDHTFEYVERMLRELFGHVQEKCKQLAEEVDSQGRTIVLTTTKEHAELKRDQIHAYGRDNLQGSKGSMWASIEAAE